MAAARRTPFLNVAPHAPGHRPGASSRRGEGTRGRGARRRRRGGAVADGQWLRVVACDGNTRPVHRGDVYHDGGRRDRITQPGTARRRQRWRVDRDHPGRVRGNRARGHRILELPIAAADVVPGPSVPAAVLRDTGSAGVRRAMRQRAHQQRKRRARADVAALPGRTDDLHRVRPAPQYGQHNRRTHIVRAGLAAVTFARHRDHANGGALSEPSTGQDVSGIASLRLSRDALDKASDVGAPHL